jgi:hypothetical protein
LGVGVQFCHQNTLVHPLKTFILKKKMFEIFFTGPDKVVSSVAIFTTGECFLHVLWLMW